MKLENGKEKLIIDLLANDYTKSILSLSSEKECSASQLSQKLGIPLATVYRILKKLEDIELIRHTKTIRSDAGNEEKFYRCGICEVNISIRDGMFSVELSKEDHGDQIIRLWKGLAHPRKD
jgi:predicted transcriptional regulator